MDRLGFFRPALPFLFAVLISTTIWVINSLNKTHTTRVDILLDYARNNDSEKGFTRKVSATISGRGFDLINFLLNDKSDVLSLTLTGKNRIPALQTVTRHVSNFDSRLQVLRVSPQWIDPPVTKLYSGKVKVIPEASFSTYGSFVKTIPAISVPDSISIYSELPLPDTLKEIHTKSVGVKQLRASWFGSSQLVNPMPDVLTLSENKVWVYQPVEEATEISLSLPVNPGTGIPYNFRFIPASITLTCLVPVSRYSVTTADKFFITASISNPEQGHAVIKVKNAPPWATNLKYTPASVEYLKIIP